MQRFLPTLHLITFFFLGAILTAAFFLAAAYLVFTSRFRDRVYPGVRIAGVVYSAASRQEILSALSGDKSLSNLHFRITDPENTATVSASAAELELKIDADLLAARAISIGRQTGNPYYNLLQIYSAYKGEIDLPLSLSLNSAALNSRLNSVSSQIEKAPVNAVFSFNPGLGADRKGRVQTFTPSQNGLSLDRDKIRSAVIDSSEAYLLNKSLSAGQLTTINIPLSIKVIPPEIISSDADKYGLHDLLGRGDSYFFDSIPGRVYNIGLGTQKVSGRLVAPDEIFSFSDSIGTVSAIFGFQKAYSIVKNKTVLDDGGGVCQVSTTLYRAVLAAGLPVVERVAHAYRVGFYEEGGFLPGLDATIYPPSPDFRFKNDTGHWLLLQADFDKTRQKLTFDIFGTSDSRETKIQGPYFLSTTPPPPPVYEDDPSKPNGTVTQVDTAHYGASVYFKRTVTRNSEVMINETVRSDYIPWPARFLKGTKT